MKYAIAFGDGTYFVGYENRVTLWSTLNKAVKFETKEEADKMLSVINAFNCYPNASVKRRVTI